MKRLLLPLIILQAFIVIACDSRPSHVLSPTDMEDVLYDYHIMQGLIDQLTGEDRIDKAQDYMNAVYVKHGITEAEFDSSLLYYNRHVKELHSIYANLQERYRQQNEELQIINGNNDMMAVFAEGGDTTNMWSGSPLIVLRNKDLLNHESFSLHADNTFRQHDQFILTFTPYFIREATDDHNIHLHAGISIHYKNGKSTGTTRMVSGNGTQQLTIKAGLDEDIERVSGFFYYEGLGNIRNMCIVDEIKLVRMHEKQSEPAEQPEPEPEPKDSIKNDSVVKDSAPTERRMSAEELRLQNKSMEQIEIQTAPIVRKQNSIGPRRRKPSRQK